MIEREAIRAAIRAAATPRLVETADAFEESARDWTRCTMLGIDTEFFRERTYRAELGLVQISNGESAWLVDPLRVGSLEPLAALFRNPSITKVFHSASEDLEVLWLTLGVLPDPMVDTQVACALIGQPLQQSYDKAVKWLCGVELDKQHTRSNWLRRPLKPEQLHYAANDVVFLPLLHRELHELLEQAGRWEWLREEVGLMLRQSQQSQDPDAAYLRIRGAGRLEQKELRILQALARWREEVAMSRNLARGFVVPDASLLQIASSQPATPEELQAVAELHPKALQRYGWQILKLVQDARESETEVAQMTALETSHRRQLDAMRDLVRAKGEALGVDPALLASRRVLEMLLRSVLHREPVPVRLRGWRKGVITDSLLSAINADPKLVTLEPDQPAPDAGAGRRQPIELAATTTSPGSSVDRAPAS